MRRLSGGSCKNGFTSKSGARALCAAPSDAPMAHRRGHRPGAHCSPCQRPFASLFSAQLWPFSRANLLNEPGIGEVRGARVPFFFEREPVVASHGHREIPLLGLSPVDPLRMYSCRHWRGKDNGARQGPAPGGIRAPPGPGPPEGRRPSWRGPQALAARGRRPLLEDLELVRAFSFSPKCPMPRQGPRQSIRPRPVPGLLQGDDLRRPD